MIYIVEHPKSGRTWVKAFIKRYATNENKMSWIYKLRVSHDGMRLFGRHNVYKRSKSFYSLDENKRVIFLARNPRDILVSFYYYAKYNRKFINMNISQFIRSKYGINQLLEFYNDWSETIKNNKKNVLFLRYENLINEPTVNFSKILKFMGVKINNKSFNEAMKYTKFENMKKREQGRKNKSEKYRKIRKGKPNDYVNHLNTEDIDYINNEISKYNNFIINYYKD